MKVTAREFSLVVVSSAISAAIVLATRLPKVPDMNNMLGLMGSLVGAGIAVVAGLLVLARQFEATDERHRRTVRNVLLGLRRSGEELRKPEANLNPTKYVTDAQTLFRAAKAVSSELRATSSSMAVIATMFEHGYVEQRLDHLGTPGLGIHPADLENCGNEVLDLANGSLAFLGEKKLH